MLGSHEILSVYVPFAWCSGGVVGGSAGGVAAIDANDPIDAAALAFFVHDLMVLLLVQI